MKRVIGIVTAIVVASALVLSGVSIHSDKVIITTNSSVGKGQIETLMARLEIPENYYGEVKADIQALAMIGIPSDVIQRADHAGETFSYLLDVGIEGPSHVTISRNEKKDITFDVREGSKTDALTITRDHRVFLNGGEVEFDITESLSSRVLAKMDSMSGFFAEHCYANARFDEWYTDRNPCPGKQWKYKWTSKTTNIKSKNRIENCSAVVIVGLLSVVTGGSFGFLYGTAAGLIQAAQGTDSKALSSKIKTYYPKGGEDIGQGKHVRKMTAAFYAKKDFKGKKKSKTYYRIRQYYD